MRASAVALALLVMLATAVPASAAPSASPTSDMLSLINSYRASVGLSPLAQSATLAGAAQWMATDMASKNYFSHTSSDGRSPQQRMAGAGYPAFSTSTGENLAAGNEGAAATLVQWQNSPGHNAILTSTSFRAVGIGVAYDASSTYKWYWAADFGGIADGAAAPPPPPPPSPTPAPQSATPTPAPPSAPPSSAAPAPDQPSPSASNVPVASAQPVVRVEPLPRAAPPARGGAPRDLASDTSDGDYHAAFVDQRAPLALPPGETGTFAIAFRNTGSAAWVRGRAGEEARLGTRDPLDRAYPELAAEWPSDNRPAIQDAARVKPGEIAWFTFRLRAPDCVGTYVLAVRPVVDGTSWLEDAGAYFEFRVALVPLMTAV